jgi:hypothetical protein
MILLFFIIYDFIIIFRLTITSKIYHMQWRTQHNGGMLTVEQSNFVESRQVQRRVTELLILFIWL